MPLRQIAWSGLSAAVFLSAFAGAARGEPTRSSTPEAQPETGVVNLNTATMEELQRLPRVGPALAGRITAYRERRPFRRIRELRRVRGIGHRTFVRLRPHVSVVGPTTLKRKLRK